jgi:hypothetical protein
MTSNFLKMFDELQRTTDQKSEQDQANHMERMTQVEVIRLVNLRRLQRALIQH